MKKKNTDDLLKELRKNCEIDNFIKTNATSFVYHKINDFWKNACEKSGMSKSNIINKSEFNYSFFYDVINGRKIPARDKIIRLALTMNLSLDDCQQALRLSDKSLLYPRIKRDSIIIYALNNGLTISGCNELLNKFNEEILK